MRNFSSVQGAYGRHPVPNGIGMPANPIWYRQPSPNLHAVSGPAGHHRPLTRTYGLVERALAAKRGPGLPALKAALAGRAPDHRRLMPDSIKVYSLTVFTSEMIFRLKHAS